MRHKQILLLLILSLISSSLAAPTLQLQNEKIQPGETVIATITTQGEFTKEIEKSQIKFFQGRKSTSLETDIFYHNKTHYLYIYTNNEENITLKIENILYKEADELKSTTLEKELEIKEETLYEENESYTQILKIKPGIIFTTSTPEVRLTNTGTKNITLEIGEDEIELTPLSTQEYTFTPEEYFSILEISTYKDFILPTFYAKLEDVNETQENETQNQTNPEKKADLKSTVELIFLELFTENETRQTIQLLNFGDDNLTQLEISHNLDFIKIENQEDFQARETRNLTLEISPEETGHYQGTINISYIQNETENLLQIPYSIFVIPKGADPENFEVEEDQTCDELQGKVCDGEKKEFCNGTALFTDNKTKYCCLDTCVSKSTSGDESGQ
jgi:hypothetical protein